MVHHIVSTPVVAAMAFLGSFVVSANLRPPPAVCAETAVVLVAPVDVTDGGR